MSQPPESKPPRLNDIVESISDGVTIIDRDWRFSYLNSAAEALSGRTRESLLGQSIFTAFPDIDETPFGPAYRRAMETGEPEVVEAWYGPLDACFEARIFPGPQGLTVLARDVSASRRASRALAESESRYRLVLRATQDALWDWDVASNQVTWNDGLARHYGHTHLPGGGDARWRALVHPEDRAAVGASLQAALEDPETETWTHEYRFARGDGPDHAWVADRGVIMRDGAGRPVRVVGALVDITERHRAAAARALRMRQDALLAQVGMAYTQSPTPRALLAACTDAMVEHLGAAFARAWLVDAEGATLVLRASAGMYTHLDGAHARVPIGAMKIGRIAAQAQAMLTNNVLEDPQIADHAWARREGLVSFAGYPLLFEGRVLGVVAMFAREPLPQSTLGLLRHACEGIALSIERFRVSRRVQHSERRFRSFVEATAHIIWQTSPEGQLQGDLSSWSGFTGQTAEQVAEDSGFGALHREDRERVRMNWTAAIRSGHPFEAEYRLRRRDGEWRTVLARGIPVRDVDDTIIEWVGTIIDLTELRDAEAALSESETRFQTMADSAPVMLWLTDQTGACVYLNRSWNEFVGQRPLTVPADPWADRVHPDDLPRLRSARHTFARDHEPYRAEYRLRDAEGIYRWVLDSASPRFGDDGVFRGYIGSVLDISARKAVERERERLLHREADARREAEVANRLKDEFLAAVSHELRTPLNAVLGWAQMLRRGVLTEAQQAKAFETIERNARLQGQLIEDLLDVSRIVSGKLRLELAPVGMAEVVQQAVDSLAPSAEAAGVDVQLALSPSETLEGDAARLQQVVWNLISNAIKFSEAGGTVVVSLVSTGPWIELVVADEGAGIDQEFLPRVFDRFRQGDSGSARQRGGLGLGLAIVRSLTELHGGTVTAHSAGLGRGSCFIVRLPVTGAVPRRSVSDGRGGANLPDIEGLRVLVVDDEPDAREMLKVLLESRGAEVHIAPNAAAGLNRLQVLRPDILLSDIGMPEMDGYMFIATIRALPGDRGGQTPAIALTAYARPQDRAKALMAGFQNHLPKPVEPEELFAVMHAALASVNSA